MNIKFQKHLIDMSLKIAKSMTSEFDSVPRAILMRQAERLTNELTLFMNTEELNARKMWNKIRRKQNKVRTSKSNSDK